MNRTFRSIVAIGLPALLVAPLAADPPERDRRRSPVVEVFEKCRDAVVNISTTRIQQVRYDPFFDSDDIFNFRRPRTREQRIESIGSGFLIHEDGYLVTNAHVVERAYDIRVVFADGREETAKTVAVDPVHDLAVLRIDARTALPHLELGRSDEIMVGETVITIGNPLGLQNTVTTGIVSALDRKLRFSERVEYTGLIQTDAAINPGNSGGPLLNVNAELIGITTAIRGDAQNVGFAIPVDRLRELLPVMLDIERRERVRFGLTVSGFDAEVASVRPGSPAQRAGLRNGDRITRLNGVPIHSGIDYYINLLGQTPGSEIRVTYQRPASGPTKTASVPLEVIPPPDGKALASDRLGIELSEFPETIRRRYELPPDVGLLVDGVRRRGPADRVDIVAGDLIRRIDRIPVRSLDEAGLVLERVKPGELVFVEGIRVQSKPPFRWKVWMRVTDGG